MAKGTIAKENVNKILQKAFGDKYIGEFDKKIYVWADDGGNLVQIAIAMTCPKNQVGPVEINTSNEMNFETDEAIVAPASFQPVEITPEEREVVQDLLKSLNL